MLSYCLNRRKNTESKNSEVVKTKHGRIMLLSNFLVGNRKELKFLKEQEVRRSLSSPGIRTHLSKVIFLGPPLLI